MEKGKGIFWGDFRKRKKERKFFLLFSEKEKGKGLKPLDFVMEKGFYRGTILLKLMHCYGFCSFFVCESSENFSFP